MRLDSLCKQINVRWVGEEYPRLRASCYHMQVGAARAIGQLWRERLFHEYHYPPFWWSKLPVVIVHYVLDNEANDIEMH